MMSKYAVLIAVLLWGCADVLMEKSSETVAATVKGKPLRHAVQVIGIPSEDKIVAGLWIVTWKVGNGVRSNYGCELRAVVDSAERISNYEIEGARGACYNWLHDLKWRRMVRLELLVIDEAKFNRFSIALKDFEKSIYFLVEAQKYQIGSVVHEALVFTAIVCYFRPFSQNEKDTNALAASQLSLADFSLLSEGELVVHEKCKELRNKALAHAEFTYHPVHLNAETGLISSAIFSLVKNAPNLAELTDLAKRLRAECLDKRADYVSKIRAP